MITPLIIFILGLFIFFIGRLNSRQLKKEQDFAKELDKLKNVKSTKPNLGIVT